MRLIDADELINQGYEIVVDGWQYDTCNKSIDIDTIPTAYSVDKVVAELDKSSDYYECEEQGREHVQMVDLTEAIEIVKQGGVDDDVCRWKFEEETGFAWHCDNKCATYNLVYAKNLKIILDDFECKCPYCGKKIKVVE